MNSVHMISICTLKTAIATIWGLAFSDNTVERPGKVITVTERPSAIFGLLARRSAVLAPRARWPTCRGKA